MRNFRHKAQASKESQTISSDNYANLIAMTCQKFDRLVSAYTLSQNPHHVFAACITNITELQLTNIQALWRTQPKLGWAAPPCRQRDS